MKKSAIIGSIIILLFVIIFIGIYFLINSENFEDSLVSIMDKCKEEKDSIKKD